MTTLPACTVAPRSVMNRPIRSLSWSSSTGMLLLPGVGPPEVTARTTTGTRPARLRHDLHPGADHVVGDGSLQLGVVGAQMCPDHRDHGIIGVCAGDVIAFAGHLTGHRRVPAS